MIFSALLDLRYRRLQQEYERAGAAVHNRNLSRRHVDVHVIDAEAASADIRCSTVDTRTPSRSRHDDNRVSPT
jgi:hypothetical protein